MDIKRNERVDSLLFSDPVCVVLIIVASSESCHSIAIIQSLPFYHLLAGFELLSSTVTCRKVRCSSVGADFPSCSDRSDAALIVHRRLFEVSIAECHEYVK